MVWIVCVHFKLSLSLVLIVFACVAGFPFAIRAPSASGCPPLGFLRRLCRRFGRCGCARRRTSSTTWRGLCSRRRSSVTILVFIVQISELSIREKIAIVYGLLFRSSWTTRRWRHWKVVVMNREIGAQFTSMTARRTFIITNLRAISQE